MHFFGNIWIGSIMIIQVMSCFFWNVDWSFFQGGHAVGKNPTGTWSAALVSYYTCLCTSWHLDLVVEIAICQNHDIAQFFGGKMMVNVLIKESKMPTFFCWFVMCGDSSGMKRVPKKTWKFDELDTRLRFWTFQSNSRSNFSPERYHTPGNPPKPFMKRNPPCILVG